MVQDEIVKKTYWMQGIITVIAMGILELFILVFSAMKNIKFENIKGPEISPAFEPFIFSLLQILPIILAIKATATKIITKSIHPERINLLVL